MIRQLRVGKGISQEELAQMADISVRTLQRVESGDKPSLETARSLASALDVSLDTIRGLTPVAPALNHDAVAHVKKLRGFYFHLAQYGVIITVLFVINMSTSASHLWFLYPALGWGIGLLFHAARVFAWLPPALGSQWERRQIEKYLDKQNDKP